MWLIRLCVPLAALLCLSGSLGAHETDQFTVPPGRTFADLGEFFDDWAYRAIERGVCLTNDSIREAVNQRRPPEVLAELQSPAHVTMAIRSQWPWSVTEIEAFEKFLASSPMRARYPGKVVAYGDRFNGMYEKAFFPLDIRGLAHILFFSSTIKVDGTYLGTDKLGHFTDVGISYYFEYRKAMDAGLDGPEAVARAVRLGTDGLNSESGMLGTLGNADYSNGDLAANFAGFLFYRDLTESTPLKGRLYPPMLLRDGAFWRIADDVRPNSGFFARFISDHLDEALNPGFFDAYLRPALRNAVRAKTALVLNHYCDSVGNARQREWFDSKLRELNTYWGVDYGHRGTYDELVSIGGSCFERGPAESPRLPAADVGVASNNEIPSRWLSQRVQRASEIPVAFAAAQQSMYRRTTDGNLGRTPLHMAAERSDGAAVASLIFGGAPAEPRDELGRTPLHAAARAGSEEVVRSLLLAAAAARVVDDYGTTPLHLACRRGSRPIVRLLLDHDADVNARSSAGVTPLHEAAWSGNVDVVHLLLEHGAKSNIVDLRGRTPYDIAVERGLSGIADALAAGERR
jgi:hypothetical protein